MATWQGSLIPDCTTTTAFRAWGQAVSTQLAALGLVRTTDTGQINWASVSAPNAQNQSMGYEIYAFADTLQSTVPVIIKFEYGSSNYGLTYPSLWITVGAATDGNGNLTGVAVGPRFQLASSSNTVGVSQRCVMSGSTNRICAALFYTAASNWMWWAIERIKDNNGNDTNQGVAFVYGCPVSKAQSVVVPGAAPPGAETDYGILMPTLGTGIRSTSIGLFQCCPFLGIQLNPMIQVFAYFNNEMSQEVPFSGTIFGATHTFFPVGNSINGVGRNSINGSHLCLLWE